MQLKKSVFNNQFYGRIYTLQCQIHGIGNLVIYRHSPSKIPCSLRWNTSVVRPSLIVSVISDYKCTQKEQSTFTFLTRCYCHLQFYIQLSQKFWHFSVCSHTRRPPKCIFVVLTNVCAQYAIC